MGAAAAASASTAASVAAFAAREPSGEQALAGPRTLRPAVGRALTQGRLRWGPAPFADHVTQVR